VPNDHNRQLSQRDNVALVFLLLRLPRILALLNGADILLLLFAIVLLILARCAARSAAPRRSGKRSQHKLTRLHS